MAVKKRKKSRFEFLTRKFPLRMQRKLVMLFMAVVLAFVVLIGRITYINVTKGSKYTKVVLDQQNYDSRVIAFKRGDIVDRNGTKMATSERVYKKAFSHEKAMEMILAGECGTFNPLLLECLTDIQDTLQDELSGGGYNAIF